MVCMKWIALAKTLWRTVSREPFRMGIRYTVFDRVEPLYTFIAVLSLLEQRETSII